MKFVAVLFAVVVLIGCAGANDAVNDFSRAAGFHPRIAGPGEQMHTQADAERFTAQREAQRRAIVEHNARRTAALQERRINSGGWVNGTRAYTCEQARNKQQRLACALAEAGVDPELSNELLEDYE